MSRLKSLREELALSQDALVYSAGSPSIVSLAVYRKAEQNKPIRYTSAKNILALINIVRSEHGKPHLVLEDLDIKIIWLTAKVRGIAN